MAPESDRSGRSIRTRLRSGEWRDPSVTILVALAAVSLVLDIATTYHVVVSPAYVEENVFLTHLASIHPLAVSAWQLLVGGAFVLVAALSFGWLSTVAALSVISINGFLGVNNLVLFVTDTPLAVVLGLRVSVAVHVVTPLVGVVTGLSIEWIRYGLPWREVLVIVTLGFLVEVGPLVV